MIYCTRVIKLYFPRVYIKKTASRQNSVPELINTRKVKHGDRKR